jgi:hypothetical protein
MSVDMILSHLVMKKQTGIGRWIAQCPAHDDRGPSLSIRELDDGRTLIHCFAGCDTPNVLAAIGMEMSDLFPDRKGDHFSPERRPFPAADALWCIAFEALVVATSGTTLLDGEPFTAKDRERLMLAVGRIQAAVDASGIRYR